MDNADTGDAGFVITRDGVALACAVDALGHGAHAATAANAAKTYLSHADSDGSLETILEGCHEALRGTRGAAVCLARFDASENTISSLNVGNIQAVHIRHDEGGRVHHQSLVMRGGVVGDRLPALRTSTTSVKPGDMLVLATDGVGFGWREEYRAGMSASDVANTLMRNHSHGRDDAMVLAIRYTGFEPEART